MGGKEVDGDGPEDQFATGEWNRPGDIETGGHSEKDLKEHGGEAVGDENAPRPEILVDDIPDVLFLLGERAVENKDDR